MNKKYFTKITCKHQILNIMLMYEMINLALKYK